MYIYVYIYVYIHIYTYISKIRDMFLSELYFGFVQTYIIYIIIYICINIYIYKYIYIYTYIYVYIYIHIYIHIYIICIYIYIYICIYIYVNYKQCHIQTYFPIIPILSLWAPKYWGDHVIMEQGCQKTLNQARKCVLNQSRYSIL